MAEAPRVTDNLGKHRFEARARGLRVVPTCPSTAGWVTKHPQAQDIVDPRAFPG